MLKDDAQRITTDALSKLLEDKDSCFSKLIETINKKIREAAISGLCYVEIDMYKEFPELYGSANVRWNIFSYYRLMGYEVPNYHDIFTIVWA